MDEASLIARLTAALPAGEGVLVGPGDDAALVRGAAQTLATADMLVEGSHFDLAFSSPSDIGFKAIAVNASDIAAMGGTPAHALISLGVGEGTSPVLLDALYAGVAEACAAFGVAVVGGDVVRSDELIVSVAMLGAAPAGGAVTRAGALPGDLVCVTGALGGAAAGLVLLRSSVHEPEAAAIAARHPELLAAHRRGRARVPEGSALAGAGARAMIDVSDGFAMDLLRVCDASRVGVELRAADLPLAGGVAEVAAFAGESPERLALGGGDDYELIVAVPPDAIDAARAAATGLVEVGRFTDGPRTMTLPDGRAVPLEAHGWDPFRS